MAVLTPAARLGGATAVAGALWGAGGLAWRATGSLAPLCFFGYLGTALAPALTYYLGLPSHRRIRGRRVITVALGVGMFAAALARAVFQGSVVAVEGLAFELLAGVAGAAVLHFTPRPPRELIDLPPRSACSWPAAGGCYPGQTPRYAPGRVSLLFVPALRSSRGCGVSFRTPPTFTPICPGRTRLREGSGPGRLAMGA